MSDTMSTKTKKKTTSKKNEVPTEDEVIPMDAADEEGRAPGEPAQEEGPVGGGAWVRMG